MAGGNVEGTSSFEELSNSFCHEDDVDDGVEELDDSACSVTVSKIAMSSDTGRVLMRMMSDDVDSLKEDVVVTSSSWPVTSSVTSVKGKLVT